MNVFSDADEDVLLTQPNQQQQMNQQQMAQMNQTGAAPSQGQPGGGMNGPWPAQVQMGSQPMGAGGKWSCHFRIFIIMIFLLLLIL